METRVINGVPYGPVSSINVGASPFTWDNSEAVRVMVAVSGGTLSVIELSPDGERGNWLGAGLAVANYWLNPGWAIKVTYTIAPTMSYTPA